MKALKENIVRYIQILRLWLFGSPSEVYDYYNGDIQYEMFPEQVMNVRISEHFALFKWFRYISGITMITMMIWIYVMFR